MSVHLTLSRFPLALVLLVAAVGCARCNRPSEPTDMPSAQDSATVAAQTELATAFVRSALGGDVVAGYALMSESERASTNVRDFGQRVAQAIAPLVEFELAVVEVLPDSNPENLSASLSAVAPELDPATAAARVDVRLTNDLDVFMGLILVDEGDGLRVGAFWVAAR